jgi:sporulation protein YlmC with PRC-barrel domain
VALTTAVGAQTPPETTPPTTSPPATQATPPATPTPTPPTPRASDSSAQSLTTIPANAATITHWYKQPIYDQGNNRIGDIDDVLIDRESKVVALMVGVGGFLGIGEKHVAVPFNAIQVTTKDNNKWYLVMNSTKDAMKNWPNFKYDRSTAMWMPDTPATTGSAPSTPPAKAPAR